jgi:aspartyl-tRNA synthetase
MNDNDFLEVITPLLTSTSPEGARDFLVPSRIHPGKFFVLPQAPQQYKQLLMVGGVDKYYQIAPCLRDEDPRADRHAGTFYQIDVEMSFPTRKKLFQTAEELLTAVVPSISDKTIPEMPFQQIDYMEAIDKYGSDKPDLRFGMEINDITSIIKGNSNFNIFNTAESVKCIVVKGGADLSRAEILEYESLAKSYGAGGLAYVKVANDVWESGISKFISVNVQEKINKAVNAEKGDLIFFGADGWKKSSEFLGKVRVAIAEKLNLIDESVLKFVWITGFPFYEINETSGKLDFGHNPFSMPQGGLKAFDAEDPLSIKSYQYDLVLNGYEILSGSIRNHDPEVLLKAFETVGYTEKEILDRFGGMYNAFQYGVPPHGGWAMGVDRLFMVLVDEPNIRDVYAFPKNSSGVDLVMNAPSVINKEDLDVVHIEMKDKGLKVYNEIKEYFVKSETDFSELTHEAVRASEDASTVRKLPTEIAVKSLILQSEEYNQKFIMVSVPANLEVDLNKVSSNLGEKYRIASTELVYEKFGIEVGGVPPFGRLLGMDLFFDKKIFAKKKIVFTPGLLTKSIVTNAQSLIRLAQPDKKSADFDFTK